MDVTLPTPFLDPAARDHVTVEGPDASSYLQSQISQDLRPLAVGASTWTLVLDPSGKVDSLARVTRVTEERFEFDTDVGFGDALAARLSRFKIRVQADISVEAASSPAPSDEHEAARVAAGWPRMGSEIVAGETIPAVTGVVAEAVSFTKGCYPGQELVERMDSRGADAPRRLRVVEVGADAAVGDIVSADDGTAIGSLTSVSPTGGLAIAVVKRGYDIGNAPAHALAT